MAFLAPLPTFSASSAFSTMPRESTKMSQQPEIPASALLSAHPPAPPAPLPHNPRILAFTPSAGGIIGATAKRRASGGGARKAKPKPSVAVKGVVSGSKRKAVTMDDLDVFMGDGKPVEGRSMVKEEAGEEVLKPRRAKVKASKAVTPPKKEKARAVRMGRGKGKVKEEVLEVKIEEEVLEVQPAPALRRSKRRKVQVEEEDDDDDDEDFCVESDCDDGDDDDDDDDEDFE